jgi:hypothetical protein
VSPISKFQCHKNSIPVLAKEPGHVFSGYVGDVAITGQTKSLNAPDADIVPLCLIFCAGAP